MNTFTCSYKIQADEANNRLYLSIRGFLIDEYVARAIKKIRNEVKKLKKGYDVIDDVSELMPATKKDADKIKKAHNYVLTKGAKRVVTVVKKDGTLENREIGDVRDGESYQTIRAGSLEEAEKLLGCE